MQRADFIHLVRLSEHASAEDSAGYRRSVARFAAVGYLWVLGCFALGLLVLLWNIDAMRHERLHLLHFGMLAVSGALLWTSLRALWCKLDAPQGAELTQADAPPLFEALERIRLKTKGPVVDHVLLDSSFNASITQLPRYGLFGGCTNYLTIGLPLLLAIDRPRFLAVMAHEYGHLRASHGQFAAWVYRTRLSWMKLEHGLRNGSGPVAMATQAFLAWYFPRFLAKTFAMARQDEFEADRIAAKIVGRDITGSALTEIAIKGSWLNAKFWPLHWSAAARSAQPIGPFAALRTLLAQPVDADFASDALRQSLVQLSDEDDTHPILRDRLEALQLGKHMPTWSRLAATELLAADGTRWVEHFDKQWCKEHASDWKLHHAYLKRVQVRIDTLTASIRRNNADEMAQLGDLQRRLDADRDVRAYYDRALQITPGHANALRGLVNCLPVSEHPARMDYLQQLFDHSVAHKWWACQVAVRALENRVAQGQPVDAALKLWRERLKVADEAERRAWEELTDTPFFQSVTRHDLNDFEKGEFQSDMARCKPVARAWLVRKVLKEFAYRRCYVLFVELPRMSDDERYTLCRTLERSLDLPGPVLVLWAGHFPTLDEIQKYAFDEVYVRALT